MSHCLPENHDSDLFYLSVSEPRIRTAAHQGEFTCPQQPPCGLSYCLVLTFIQGCELGLGAFKIHHCFHTTSIGVCFLHSRQKHLKLDCRYFWTELSCMPHPLLETGLLWVQTWGPALVDYSPGLGCWGYPGRMTTWLSITCKTHARCMGLKNMNR